MRKLLTFLIALGAIAFGVYLADAETITTSGGGGTTPAFAKSGALASITGTLTETPLASITIPANVIGSNGALRITSMWSMTNSANVKSIRIKLGGSGISGQLISAQTNLTAVAGIRVDTFLMAANATNAQNTETAYPRGTDEIMINSGTLTSTVDLTVANTLAFTAQLASSGETISLLGYIVEVVN